MKKKISLGPLLGIEGDERYSLLVLLPNEIEGETLTLRWSYLGDRFEGEPSVVEPLLSNTAYRFEIPIKRQPEPFIVAYELLLEGEIQHNQAGTSEWEFVVPGADTLPKVGFASCNGSSEEHPDDVSDTQYIMWYRLWEEHTRDRLEHSFHCLLMCGDQIYADTIWDKVKYFEKNDLLKWPSTWRFKRHKIPDAEKADLERQIATFYEELYLASWNIDAISRTLASVPSAMMWDDHDIIDGWGSYPEKLQNCEIFQLIYKVAKRYFEILQIRTRKNTALIAEDYFSQKLSFRNYEILILDNRTYRTHAQIMSPDQYAKINEINDTELFSDCPTDLNDQRVVLFAIPVPVAHLNYASWVESWLRALFGGDFRRSYHDDALDHWDHQEHEPEQKQLIDLIFAFGDRHLPKYVHIVSGDVHSAGAGFVERDSDARRVGQIVSSAIVHEPMPKIAQRVIGLISRKESKIEGYRVEMDQFGHEEDDPKTIYERNFGFLYKYEKGGIKYYLALEHSKDDYEWKQPRKFDKDPSSDA